MENEKAIESLKGKVLYQPTVDILESESEFLVLADCPGAKPESIDVHFEKGILTVSADVEERVSGLRALRREYGVGGFQRSFRIGDHIDAERISARMANGVLHLTLPKRAEVQPKKIVVQHA